MRSSVFTAPLSTMTGAAALVLAACADPSTGPAPAPRATVGPLQAITGTSVTNFASSATTARCGSSTTPLASGPALFSSISLPTPGGNTYDLTSKLGTPMSAGGENPGWPTVGVNGAWIGVDANANEYGAVLPGSYCFDYAFDVPTGATNLQLNLTLRADNYAFVYMNNTKIGESGTLADNMVNWNNNLTITANASEGMVAGATNHLRIVLVNTYIGYNGTPGSNNCAVGPQTGSDYQFGVPGALSWSISECRNPSALNFWGQYAFTARGYWCSPGFWKNADDAAWAYVGASKTTKYNSINGTNPDLAGDPSIFDVVSNPNVYGGPAANIAANYISSLGGAGWGGTQATGENCPLNNKGKFVGVSQ